MNELKKILVPVDFSPCSRRALQCAASMPSAPQARIDVLHVWRPPPVPFFPDRVTAHAPPVEMKRFEVEAAMKDFIEAAAIPDNVDLRETHQNGSPADVIVDLSDDYDLVVMGTHGRSGIERIILGSVAERVVREASCPVLAVHEADPLIAEDVVPRTAARL